MTEIERYDEATMARYIALAAHADQVTEEQFGFLEQMIEHLGFGWEVGADPIEVITDDIICGLPDGWELNSDVPRLVQTG